MAERSRDFLALRGDRGRRPSQSVSCVSVQRRWDGAPRTAYLPRADLFCCLMRPNSPEACEMPSQPPGSSLKTQGIQAMVGIVSPKNRGRNSEILNHYRRGLTYSAIAALMGISRNVVAGIIKRSTVEKRGGIRKPFENLTGRLFGHWKVIGPTGPMKDGNHQTFLCQCVCGARRRVQSGNLKSGRSKSCGCGVVTVGRPRKAA